MADRLMKAGRLLPAGIRLSLLDAWRPLSLQRQYFDSYVTRVRSQHPEWSDQQIFGETTKFVAPPANIPPHTTGGAIDITLMDSENKELEMGAASNDPFAYDQTAETLSPGISDEAKANRKLMAQALDALSFVNYPTEWWHWSYGDRYWAYYRQQPVALYGSVEV